MNWVAFVGEGRSGHTVISGALGSHPHARISEEQKYISKWLRGWTKEEILADIHRSGVGKARRAQGWKNLNTHTEPLELIGDKCGWDAVNEHLKRGSPITCITGFSEFINLPVKTIVTVRSPEDNIANWVMSNKYSRIFPNESLRQHRMIRRYRRFYKTAWEIIQGTDYYLLHHERFLQDPSKTLDELCSFLGLSEDEEWKSNCLKIIHPNPNRRYDRVAWTAESKDKIKHIIDTLPLMEYYR